MRLQGRHITREAILDAVDTYEVVESYPQEMDLPSYLILAHDGGEAFHVLFATDVAEENVRVVTAYRSSADEWEGDGKRGGYVNEMWGLWSAAAAGTQRSPVLR